MKQFDLTVKIRVSLLDADPQAQYDEAMIIARHYANMAMTYMSVGADEIVEVKAEVVE